jgi:hypothetical protein
MQDSNKFFEKEPSNCLDPFTDYFFSFNELLKSDFYQNTDTICVGPLSR